MLDLKKKTKRYNLKDHNLNFKFRDIYLYIVFFLRPRIVLITSNAFCSYIMRSGFKSYDLNEA